MVDTKIITVYFIVKSMMKKSIKHVVKIEKLYILSYLLGFFNFKRF
jgi:hypothetical protein